MVSVYKDHFNFWTDNVWCLVEMFTCHSLDRVGLCICKLLAAKGKKQRPPSICIFSLAKLWLNSRFPPEWAGAADRFRLSLAAALARRPRSPFALERANPGRGPPSLPTQWQRGSSAGLPWPTQSAFAGTAHSGVRARDAHTWARWWPSPSACGKLARQKPVASLGSRFCVTTRFFGALLSVAKIVPKYGFDCNICT